MTGRLFAGAITCAALFVGLGLWVTHHPPSRIDLAGESLRGSGMPLAVAFTNSGYGVVLTVLGVLTVGGSLVLRVSPRLPLAIVASQLGSQFVVNLAKGLFDRARPAAWVYRHEPGFSYPSGHATTAVVFYGAWLIVVWNSSLPVTVRVVGAALLAAWALGIGWSRVALGAHYITDVMGGVLFGIGWLCLIAGIALRTGTSFAGHA